MFQKGDEVLVVQVPHRTEKPVVMWSGRKNQYVADNIPKKVLAVDCGGERLLLDVGLGLKCYFAASQCITAAPATALSNTASENKKSEDKYYSLGEASTADLLAELASRGGPIAILAEAGLLQEKKSQDYNYGIERDQYFPFGQMSYVQMLHIKQLRLTVLTKKLADGGLLNFESISDTLQDMINYASFNADWLKRQKTGS